jgi:hypothetical protein
MADTNKQHRRTRVLFCNCAFANVVPPEVKSRVLDKLCDSNVTFHAVGDLCDLAARRDPALRSMAQGDSLRIAACFPRAVRCLFQTAGVPLDEQRVEVLNMRTESADHIVSRLLPADTTRGECCP